MESNETPPFDINAACNDFLEHAIKVGPVDEDGKPCFVVDKDNEVVIKSLVKYFSQEKGVLKLNKGIFLRGPVGTGKTCLMSAFSTWRGNKSRFKPVSVRDIQKESAMSGFKSLLMYSKKSYHYKNGNFGRDNGAIIYCFDDFGAEKTSKYYGTEINVMEELIQDRYIEFQETGMLTHVTSNLKDGDLIEKVYGIRCRDRLREMFNFVDLLGNTRRI